MQRIALRYLSSRRAHPIRWQFIDLGEGAAMVALLWFTIGQTAGIAFAVFWAALMLLGLIPLVARLRNSSQQ